MQAAAATAAIARDEVDDASKAKGLTDWNIADVARTALAWSRFQRPEADGRTLLHLCNMNSRLIDEGELAHPQPADRLARVLPRLFFEQFLRQRSVMGQITRTLLLFGATAEQPPGFAPKAMLPGWFEVASDGLTLEEYVESIFMISVGTQEHRGGFSLDWLDGEGYRGLEDVISFDALRRTFTEHLLTTPSAFKDANRRSQDPVPPPQKKFAFNPLVDRPFIEGVAEIPIAPWVQAVIAKASPASVYHLACGGLGKGFADDLGPVFQHYVGRHLELVEGPRQVIPELRYGPRQSATDSCDWFLDLPNLLVLIECKARQPIESLRIGGDNWLKGIADSTGKGIDQLNKSNRFIDAISSENPQIDATKPRVGLIVTLEPFYLNENWLVRERLLAAELPIGVVSAGELESLVLLHAEELSEALASAVKGAQDNVMLLTQALNAAEDRENPLLVSTWESIGLFGRVSEASHRLRAQRP